MGEPFNARLFVLLFTGIFVLIGMIFWIIGYVMKGNQERKVIRCTSSCEGEIIALKRDHDSSAFYPVYKYQVNGETMIKRSHYGSSHLPYQIHDTLTIMYNPENIKDSYILEDQLPQRIHRIFMGFGIFFLVLGVGIGIIIALVIRAHHGAM